MSATALAGRSGRRTQPSWGNTAIGLVIIAVMLFPVYWMVNVSLQPGGSAVATPWFPTHVSFSGYSTALSQQSRNLATSLAVALGSVVLSVVIAAPAAYALAHFKIRLANAFLFAILLSQMIPGIVIANALYAAYNDVGLLNSIPGLILADSTAGIPFAILIVRAFMTGIPPSIVEAGRVDGAGYFRAFVSIVLPMSRNAL